MKSIDQISTLLQALLESKSSDEALHTLQDNANLFCEELVEKLRFLANHYSDEGEMDCALRFADLAIHAAESLGIDRLRADSQFTRAIMLHRTGYLAEAKEYYERASMLYQQLKAQAELGNCLGNLGLIAEDLGNLSEATEYHRAALELSRQCGNLTAQLADLTNLSAVYYSEGDYPRAEEGYLEVLRATEVHSSEDEMNACAGLGLIYRTRGELVKSRDHFERALTIAGEIHDHRGEAAHLGNLGLVYQDMGDLRRALELHQTAAELHAKAGNRQSQANQLGNTANVYYALGDISKAETLHQQSLELHRTIGFQRGQAEELAISH